MPSTRDTRALQIVDPVLSQLAVQYTPRGFVAPEVAAAMDVTKETGQYPVFDESYFFRAELPEEVADRAPTPEVDFRWSTDLYRARPRRLKTSITPRERDQADNALRLEQSKLNMLLLQMQLGFEVRLARLLRHTSNGGQLTGGAHTPTSGWDTSTGDPEADIRQGKLAVHSKTGLVPDALILPFEVAYALATNPKIREIVKYTVNGQQVLEVGDRLVPATLHGCRVIVAQGTLVNTAPEGQAKSLAQIWGKSARLVKLGRDNEWGTPATVYQFRCPVSNTVASSEQRGVGGFRLVDRWSEPDPPVDYIRAWECTDEKVVAPDTGYEIVNVIS